MGASGQSPTSSGIGGGILGDSPVAHDGATCKRRRSGKLRLGCLAAEKGKGERESGHMGVRVTASGGGVRWTAQRLTGVASRRCTAVGGPTVILAPDVDGRKRKKVGRNGGETRRYLRPAAPAIGGSGDGDLLRLSLAEKGRNGVQGRENEGFSQMRGGRRKRESQMRVNIG